LNASNLFLSLILHLGNLFLIVQLHFSKLFLILKSGVNHTSRGSISTSTLPSIKLRKCSSKIITSILRSEERFSRNAETDLVCRLPISTFFPYTTLFRSLNASNLFLSLILHLGNLFLIVQLHFSKLFLILKSGVNHTSRGSISTSTLPSIKLRKCSSKIITSILSFISGRLAT